MSRIKALLERFSRDQRGNVAMMFGLAAIPMVAAAGTAIDYGRLSTSQSKIHAALDAAVLAVARDPSISVDPDTAAGQLTRSKIQSFFAANLYDKNLLENPNVILKPTTGDKVLVEVTGCVKMAFANFTSILNPCVKASSEVTRGGSVKMEVALAMDNSGSMSGGKMDEAKIAAKDFVQTLLSAAVTPDHVKVSVIPFTNTVNTGLSRTSPGLDTNGQSPIHWENLTLTNTKPAGIASRFTLFDQLNQTWGGCMETRPGAYGTNDDAPSNSVPSSLYVPFFYPDEPGDKSNGSQNTVYSGTLNEYSNAGSATYIRHNSYLNDDGGSANTHDANGREISPSTDPACSGSPFTLPYNSSVSNWRSRNWLARSANNICRYNLTGTSGGNIGSRHTIGRDSYLATRTGFNATRENYKMGPNMTCHTAPIARLTNNQSSLTTSINAMVNYGGTNIFDGFMWAWRTLSPNAPFSDGRSYTWTDPLYKNRKIIVLMTDGDNQWNEETGNPNGSGYTVNGYYRNNRLATGITTTAQAKTAMDSKTLEACNNAKAKKNAYNEDAITIYTIGFSTPNALISADGETLLQNCASVVGGQRLYYKATTAAELKSVFAGIAAELSKLKLSK